MAITYIAGYDGSDASRAALAFTTGLARSTGAEVLAATVWRRSPEIYGIGVADEADIRDRRAQEHAEERLTQLGVEGVTACAVGARSPAEGLQQIAEERSASMLAVGTTHRGVVGRVVTGSVADHLLHGAPCPVAVVPPGAGERPIRTIGVAYDRRDESRGALHAAEELAGRLHARLVVIAVYEPVVTPTEIPALAPGHTSLDEQIRTDLEKETKAVVAGMTGITAEARVVSGSPSRVLVDIGAGDVDLLVLGSRGYGLVRGVLLGSVSRHVVDHAPCPVMVMPRGVAADVLGKREATATA